MTACFRARVEGTTLKSIRLLALIASLLTGVAAALALMPFVFRNTPTDISRVGIVLDSLRDPAASPGIVVFGNSVIMSGIDAGRLREVLPDHPLAWNCASTGQTLAESMLLSQTLPSSVKTVVYGMQLVTGDPADPLHPLKANTYYMYGFRPDAESLDLLGRIYGDGARAQFTRSHLAQLFQARWVVRQLADTQLRILLRSDLKLASAETSLLHPQRYTAPIAPELLARQLTGHEAALATDQPRIPEPDRALARALAELGARAGRRTVFLVPPVHATLVAGHPGVFERGADELARSLADLPATRVIDASGLLGAGEFIDDMHPTDPGSLRLTDFLAAKMGES